jgi:hypothetical protein
VLVVRALSDAMLFLDPLGMSDAEVAAAGDMVRKMSLPSSALISP